jgi:TolA-binding protein
MVRLYRGLLILVAWLGGAGPVMAAGSAETRAFDVAATAFQIHAWDFADKKFGEFVQKYPKSARLSEAILYQGEAKFQNQQYADAISLLTTNRDRAGMWEDEYLNTIAQAYFRRGDYQDAATAFASLVADFPNYPRRLEASISEATALCRLGNWAQATRVLEATNGVFAAAARSSETNALVSWGYLLLGEAQLAQKHFAEAGWALEKLDQRTLNPELQWRRAFLRGRWQLETDRLNEALDTSTRLLELAGALAQSASESGPATVQADVAGAFTDLNPAALVPESWLFRARTMEALNRLDDAVAAYTNNLATNAPVIQQRHALLRIAELNLAQDRIALAIQSLTNYLSQHPQGAAVDMANLAIGELLLKQHAAAVATNPPADKSPAARAQETNLVQQALARFDLLLNTYSNSPLAGKALLDKGWCLWAEGRYAQSAAAFQEAAERLPFSEDQAVAQFKLADSEFMLTNLPAAISNYQRVVDVYDAQPEIAGRLGERALYQIVRAALAENNLPVATDALRAILQRYPDSFAGPQCLLLLGQGYMRESDTAGARDLFADFEKRYPASELLPEVRMAIARTYEQDGNWTEAIRQYDHWLSAFTNHDDVARAEFARALDYYRAGQASNALALLTNFVARFGTNELARRAQWWIAGYYFNLGDYQNAEQNYQLVYKSTNWPASDLTYHAQMMAGRAAIDRSSYKDAYGYFTNLASNPNCPPDLKYRAYFAIGDALMNLDSNETNRLSNLAGAIAIFKEIPSTNELAMRALGSIGNCYLQWAATDPAKYDDASNAYSQVIRAPGVDVAVRSQAGVGLGTVAEGLARLKTGDDRTRLLEQAYQDYLSVFLHQDTVHDGEQPDPFWIKRSGIEAGRLAETLQKWDPAYRIYRQLENWYPSLTPLLEPKILKICRAHPELCAGSN